MIYGSILAVQILAHLPLTDIQMPANVLQVFQVTIGITSFDYFAPFEYLDADFNETWSWSSSFEWVGYDSVNFLPALGSIVIFYCLQILMIILALALYTCRL